MKRFLFIAPFIVCMALSACSEPTAEYLMEHPNELFKAEAKCQSMRSGLDGSTTKCKMVMSAALFFRSLVEEESADPQAFGKRVIAEQIALVNAQTELEKARATNGNVAAAEKDYENKLRDVKILLAVISLRSPD